MPDFVLPSAEGYCVYPRAIELRQLIASQARDEEADLASDALYDAEKSLDEDAQSQS